MALFYHVNFLNYILLVFKLISKFPAWFQAVQTMACFSFMANVLAVMFLIITASTSYRTSVKLLSVSATFCFLTSMNNFIFLCFFLINFFINLFKLYSLLFQ
jgi:hypothetical protein